METIKHLSPKKFSLSHLAIFCLWILIKFLFGPYDFSIDALIQELISSR